MKRPEKKELSNEGNRCVQVGEDYIVGYNQACDDWEKYLPTVEELETLIESRCGIPIIVTLGGGNLAEDIHKRLIGECNHVFVSAHNAGTKDIAMECGNCGKIIKPGATHVPTIEEFANAVYNSLHLKERGYEVNTR